MSNLDKLRDKVAKLLRQAEDVAGTPEEAVFQAKVRGSIRRATHTGSGTVVPLRSITLWHRRFGMKITQGANGALDAYIEYIEYEGDEIGNEDRRWQFIDEALEVLEALTGRKVADELEQRRT